MSLLAAAYGTVSDIEVLWTLLGLIGFVVALYCLRDARRDARVLRIETGGLLNGRAFVTRYHVMQESIRATVQFVFMCIGILAMTIPSAPNELNQPLTVVIVGIAIRWGLILAAALLLTSSLLALQFRHRTLRDLPRRDT